MPRGPSVKIMGVWLCREGSDIVVFGENIYGDNVELIREYYEGPISHRISEHGIAERFNADYWQRQRKIREANRAIRSN